MDTEDIWFQVEADFAARRGAIFTPEQALTFVGRPMSQISGALKRWTEAPESIDQITDLLNQGVIERLSKMALPWRPGMEALTGALHERGVPLALVSSSTRQILDAIVARLPTGLFQVVIGSEDVTRLKPDPQPYRLAAKALGVDPSHTAVIEDSPAGLESGLRAGANVIGVPCMAPIEDSPGISRFDSAADIKLQDLSLIAQGQVVDRLA